MNRLFAEALFTANDIGYQGVSNADKALTSVLNTVYLWAGIIAVIVLIIAGFMYVTSDGDSGRTQRAKNAILATVVGLVVIIMAFTITNYVVGRF